MQISSTQDSIESDGKVGQGPPAPVVFRQDLFKKSLRNFGNKSINLPKVVHNFNQMNGGRKARGQQTGTLEPHNGRNDRHNQSKLLTAHDSQSQEQLERSTDMRNESTGYQASLITESQGKSQIRSVQRHAESQGALNTAKRKRVRGQALLNICNLSTGTGEAGRATAIAIQQRLATTDSRTHMHDSVTDPSVSATEFNNFMALSTRNVPTKLIERNSGSVNVLPVIGSEIDYKNAVARINSKVELTRKDIQNYLVNGSISKEFITTNKKELQKFIKQRGRKTSEFMVGYQTFSGNEKSDGRKKGLESNKSLDTILSSQDHHENNSMRSSTHLNEPSAQQHRTVTKDFSHQSSVAPKPQLVGPSTIYISNEQKKSKRGTMSQKSLRKSEHNDIAFPTDVKIERPIKGEITTRALETWINETLLDAYHLEIPGVLSDPEKKKPIYSYGVDPITLQSLGVSHEDVDRIYRALFVYSVGFFEFLKKILQATKSNYAIITSIWKVYQVLLEYCCKTDYRILIAEISDRHHAALDNIAQSHRVKIQKLQDEKQIMKQNLENQQIQCDHFEKERDQEKNHRLKLEDEYMSHQQNHEEEVKLRLKFEGKFNNMHSDHRELQINHDRKLVEFVSAQRQVKDYEQEIVQQSKELIEIKLRNVNLEAIVADLKEYKLMAEKEIRNQTNTLISAEQKKLDAMDSFQLQRYAVQESVKDMNDIKCTMNIQEQKIKDLDAALNAAKIEKTVFEQESDRLRILNEEITQKFESRHGRIEEVETELEAIKCTDLIQKDELQDLRRRLETSQKQLDLITEVNAETRAKDQTLDVSNKKISIEMLSVQDQLQQMNVDRHRLMVELKNMTSERDELTDERDMALRKIERLQTAIDDSEYMLHEFKLKSGLKEEKMNANIQELNDKKHELEHEVQTQLGVNIDVDRALNYQKEQNCHKTEEIAEMKNEIQQQKDRITGLVNNIKTLDDELAKLYQDLAKEEYSSMTMERAKREAEERQCNAEQITDTLQETVKTMRRQLKEERQQLEIKRNLYFMTMEMDKERDIMASEEVVSRYGMMKEENEAAVRMRDENQAKLDHYIICLEESKQQEEVIAIAKTQIGALKEQVDDQWSKLGHKSAEIVTLTQDMKNLESTMKTEHNIETNELEQKISAAKLTAQQDKNASVKEKREIQQKVKELQKQVKELQRQPASKQGGKGKSPVKAGLLPEVGEIATQTNMDSEQLTKLLGAEKKFVKVQSQLKKAKQAITKMKSQNVGGQIEGQMSKLSVPSSSRQKVGQLTQDGKLRSDRKSNRSIAQGGDEDEDEDDDDEEKQSDISLPTSDDDISLGDNDSDVDGNDEVDQFGKKSQSRHSRGQAKSSMHSRAVSHLSAAQMQGMTAEEIEESQRNNEKLLASERSAEGELLKSQAAEEDTLLEEELEEQKAEKEKQDLDLAERQQKLIELFIREERNVLLRIEKAVELGEVVHPSQIKIWRSEIRIPVMLQNVKLTGKQQEELGQTYNEQVDYCKKRALRMIEEGSQYSSDYEEVDQSEYLTTDGEDQEKDEIIKRQNMAANVKVQRGNEKHMFKQPGLEKSQTGVNWTGEPIIEDGEYADGEVIRKSLDVHANSNNDTGGDSKMSAVDRITAHLKMAQDLRKSEELRKSQQGTVRYSHEIDENQMPVIQYVINKNKLGEDITRRRIIKKERKVKIRDDGYDEERARIQSARAKNRSKKVETNIKKYENIYSRFAENYTNTLDTLVDQSKKHLLNKAKNRRKMHEIEDVANIKGRELGQFLIQQMKELPAWQIHLDRLQKELGVQENKWDKREEEQLELEKKREEVAALEDEMERVRAQHRRESIEIIHEDAIQPDNDQSIEMQQRIDQLNIVEGPEEPFEEDERRDKHITTSLEQMEWSSEKDDGMGVLNIETEEAKYIDEVSIGTPVHEAATNSQLQILLQESKAVRETQGILDAELSDLTRGGVNAVARQSEMARVQLENQLSERQAENENRARKRDIILKQTGMLPKQRDDEKKAPGKLGPSSIRTLIRAADSRTNQ